MTDRGQLDLISLLVNLFLSPFLVHHSYTFYPLLPPPPRSLSLVFSFPHLQCFLLTRSFFPHTVPASLTSFTLPPPPRPPFPRPSFFLILAPSCSPRVNHSFIFFGHTLSCISSTRHPGPFIIPLLCFAHSFDNFRSPFNFIILKFAKASLARLSHSLSLDPLLCVYACLCVCLSLAARLPSCRASCMCKSTSMWSCHCLLSALAILRICCHASSTNLN